MEAWDGSCAGAIKWEGSEGGDTLPCGGGIGFALWRRRASERATGFKRLSARVVLVGRAAADELSDTVARSAV